MGDRVRGRARRLLVGDRGGDVSPESVSRAAERACERLALHFARLVGDTGVRAILARSLTTTRAAYPWLATARATTNPPWTILHDAMSRRPADESIAAFAVLFSTFAGLLGRFIGDDLTTRLLREAWPDVFPPAEELHVNKRVVIEKLPTGVPGLDEVLGGGLPEFSFNLIAGGPGCGKTTLAHQIMFATGEPRAAGAVLHGPRRAAAQDAALPAAVHASSTRPRSASCVRFVHLGERGARAAASTRVLDAIVRGGRGDQARARVRRLVPRRGAASRQQPAASMELQSFMQRLALHLTSWEATTFLIGEYEEREAEATRSSPWPTASSGCRRRRPQLDRAQAAGGEDARPGARSPACTRSRISDDGPARLPAAAQPRSAEAADARRRSSGARPAIAGARRDARRRHPGRATRCWSSGRRARARRCCRRSSSREGIAQRRAGVIAVFEKRPDEYLTTHAERATSWSKLVGGGQAARCSTCARWISRSTRRCRRSRAP